MCKVKWTLGLVLVLCVLLLVGCDWFGADTSPTEVPPTAVAGEGAGTPPGAGVTSVVATDAPPEATSTPEPETTSTPEPVATTPPLEPVRIQFAPGATSLTVSGRVEQLGKVRYVLNAEAGEVMDAVLTAPRRGVLLAIAGADGTLLKSHTDGLATWQGALPATQDYFIDVVSVGQATDYELTISIPPPASPVPTVPTTEPEPEAMRIQFASGATSATVSGHVMSYGADLYVLGAMGGQTMDVVLDSPASDVLLEIWGEDGTVLKRHVDGETWWNGTLPSTQDYYLKVVSFGSEVDYTLTVTIPPLVEEPEPVRIQFASGATSATVSGHVVSYGADLYVLGAMGGQTMDVVLDSPASDVLLEIWGEDGTVLKRHVDGETWWNGTLPSTQDYYLKVVSFGSEVDYTLTVTIPPL